MTDDELPERRARPLHREGAVLMCVCVAPGAAPFLMPLLEWLLAALWAATPYLLVFVAAAGVVFFSAVCVVVRALVALISWPIVAWLDRRSDRTWNEQVAARMRVKQPPRVAVEAARPRVAVEAARPRVAVGAARSRPVIEAVRPRLAIEAVRPRPMPASVRMYATPRKELVR